METLNIRDEDRRSSSGTLNTETPQETGMTNSITSYGSIQTISRVPTTQAPERATDPLTFLIPMTDAVLIITAIIFIMAIGIVALLVMMAIIKIHFIKTDLNSFWTNEWFSTE